MVSRKYPLREIWNALMYIARTGCSWRQLPHDFPPWGDVEQVIPKGPGQKTFKVLPRRRVVERTFAWLRKYRRLRADYESTVSSSRAWILLAMTSLMARRLRPA